MTNRKGSDLKIFLTFSIFLFLDFCSVFFVSAFLPEVMLTEWEKGANVPLRVSSLNSVNTLVPLPYYSLPFCRPKVIINEHPTIGEILLGDVIQNSPYEINVLENVTCKDLCKVENVTSKEMNSFKTSIEDNYQINWILDSLYNGIDYKIGNETFFSFGFPVGYIKDNKHYLFNHVSITLQYNEVMLSNKTVYRIVGFKTTPYSIMHQYDEDKKKHLCQQTDKGFSLDDALGGEVSSIVYTYSVSWQKSDLDWSGRWDIYLTNSKDSPMIHWFPIINSLVIVLLLSVIVAMILIRILYRDITRYNERSSIIEEDEVDETGWKLVHADVFRKPLHSTLLAALVGSGMQILGMVLVTVILAGVGLFSPDYRSRLLQFMIFLWSAMGAIAGFTSAKFYKMFKSSNWKMTTIRTALIFPGVVFVIFFILDLLYWGKKSSAAVPFSTLVTLLLLWFGISIPLVFLGAYVGYKQESISLPVRVNKIPRQIPTQSWLMNPILCCFAGGCLPFGAMFTELFFLLTSLWQHRFYYLFGKGFLFLVLIILCITCAETSINLVYFHLICEDYNWWWRSFFVSGSSGVYVFLYSIYHAAFKLKLTHTTGVLIFLGYSFIISYGFFILTGSVGFIASFFFLRKIYGSIKVD